MSGVQVKFTERYQYETEGRNQGPTFDVGQVETFREDIAERFIRRGVAVRHDGRTAPAAAKSVEAPPSDAARPAKSDAAKGGAKPAADGKA